MNTPDYSTYSFRQLYEALDQLRGDQYPQVLKALEDEIARRQKVDKPTLEETYFRLNRERFPQHEHQLRARIDALGGFDTIAPETVTPENQYQTGWRRFWALVFDNLILALLLGSVAAQLVASGPDDIALKTAVDLGSQFVILSYFILMHAAFGQTLGKMITGVRVVRNADLQAIGLRHALVRDIVPVIFFAIGIWGLAHVDIGISEGKDAASEIPPLVLMISLLALVWGILEVITMLFNRRRRALHDFIAATVVVRYLRGQAKPAATGIQEESATAA